MRQLTAEGMPRVGRGAYPLKASVQWYVDYWRRRAQGREGDEERKKKQTFENAILEAKLKEATGNLIDRQEVVMVWSSAFLRLGKWLDKLPGNLGRECNLSSDTVRVMRELVDEGRRNFVRDSAEFIEVVEPKDNAGAAKKRA